MGIVVGHAVGNPAGNSVGNSAGQGGGEIPIQQGMIGGNLAFGMG